MPTITVKIPLYKLTKAKQKMYETIQQNFSVACNETLDLKQNHPNLKASEINHILSPIQLPTTLIQEARKLGMSCFQDWKKNQKTKGFPSFRKRISLLFNNQNWRFRFDNGFLKLGIPTVEEGKLTIDKYIPLQSNDYNLFWVNYLVTGEMDTESRLLSKSKI